MPLIDGLPDRDAAESALADYLESYPDDLNDDLIVVRIESDR
jgi:hypothetical protein